MMMLASLLAGEPAALVPSREQMAFTLGYHIILVPLGVGFPFLTVLMEGIGLRRNDPAALRLARRWSVVMAVQFAVGAVTGTILSFEFGILWPRMMGRFGDVFGIGFAIEGIAFFLEAIFIGVYLYGWRRLPPRLHYALGWVLPPAGLLGAFGVIIANSWMNTPAGFQLGPTGRPVNVNPAGAIFTPALGYEFWHLIIALYMTAGFMVASVYAAGWLRGRRHLRRCRPAQHPGRQLRAPGVRRHGRSRCRRLPPHAVVRRSLASEQEPATIGLVLPGSRPCRSGLLRRNRVWLGHNRGRPSTLDRVRADARRRCRESGQSVIRLGHVLGAPRHVRRDRVLLHHHPAAAVSPLEAGG